MLTPSGEPDKKKHGAADDNVNVEPVLYRAGYTVQQIEGEVRVPLRMMGALKQKKIEANAAACPDLLLSGKRKSYLIVECKAALFGAGNGAPQRQARTLMLQTPTVLTETLTMQPGAETSSHLLYLTAHDDQRDQLGSLQ